jgi:hypothetical protein
MEKKCKPKLGRDSMATLSRLSRDDSDDSLTPPPESSGPFG